MSYFVTYEEGGAVRSEGGFPSPEEATAWARDRGAEKFAVGVEGGRCRAFDEPDDVDPYNPVDMSKEAWAELYSDPDYEDREL